MTLSQAKNCLSSQHKERQPKGGTAAVIVFIARTAATALATAAPTELTGRVAAVACRNYRNHGVRYRRYHLACNPYRS